MTTNTGQRSETMIQKSIQPGTEVRVTETQGLVSVKYDAVYVGVGGRFQHLAKVRRGRHIDCVEWCNVKAHN